MKLNCNSFFDGDFEEYNLNDWYIKNQNFIQSYIIDTRNPQQIQKALHLQSKDKYYYGGYGENRKDIWKGTYLDDKKNYIHLGIDINMPAGTPIKCPFDCMILSVFSDRDTKIGWGGRLILMPHDSFDSPMLVLAHLDPNKLVLNNWNPNKNKGDILAKIGNWPQNGNTFHHLHIQCIWPKVIHDFDGYGTNKDLKDNPNPFEVEW